MPSLEVFLKTTTHLLFFLERIFTHCLLHRHTLASKTLPQYLKYVLAKVVECVNYIRSPALVRIILCIIRIIQCCCTTLKCEGFREDSFFLESLIIVFRWVYFFVTKGHLCQNISKILNSLLQWPICLIYLQLGNAGK